jgi:C-terminal processing protease CtpA/Prc
VAAAARAAGPVTPAAPSAAVPTPPPATSEPAATEAPQSAHDLRVAQAAAAAAHAMILRTHQSANVDLGLSEGQKQAIETLKRNRDLQTQVYRDQIDAIEGQTELAIRQLLDVRQQQLYDAKTRQIEVEGQLGLQIQETAPPPANPNPAYLGVTAENVPGGGAKITTILPNTAAGRYGLQPNDEVLEFNMRPVSDFSAFAQMIREQRSGDYVTLKVRRGGAVFNQGVELGGH